MAAFGSIGEFDAKKEAWGRYIERLSEYFAANNIENATRQRAILNSVVGATTYALFTKLLAPKSPTECTFEEIKTAMNSHTVPATSVIVERFRFNSRFRSADETVQQYVAELRGMAQKCDFANTQESRLDSSLRDRFVVGLREERIQRHLLSQGDKLTFAKAVELAHTVQLADQNTSDLTAASGLKPVNAVGKGRGQGQGRNNNGHRKKYDNKSKSGGSSHAHSQGSSHSQYQSQSGNHDKGKQTNACYRCGKNHNPDACWAKSAQCHRCNGQGHIARMCKKPQANFVTAEPEKTGNDGNTNPSADHQQVDTYGMYTLSQGRKDCDPIYVEVEIDEKKVKLEVDTGAAVTIINESVYRNTWDSQTLPLQQAKSSLYTYTGECIPILGEATVHVSYNDQSAELPLIVVQGEGPNLLGRNWLCKIRLAWETLRVNTVQTTTKDSILENHKALFRDELGKLKGYQVHIDIKPDAKPKFCKPRQVPLALKSKVEESLKKLEDSGVIERVTFSRWAAPIVPIVKATGDLRICGDYKITVNPVAQPDTYPLPRIEELFAKLVGGQTFSKLDLSSAYAQLELDEASREMVTINTHLGLFRYNRCPYGISTAPSLFQRTMDSLLADIPHTAVFLDDVLITGATEEEHLANLETVMSRLEIAGLRLRKTKCVFFQEEVTYLGHRISANGLHPTAEKMTAIQEAPAPQDTTQLKSFLGLVNYYGRFFQNLSTTLAPLHGLLGKSVKWCWGKAQQEAFDACKSQLSSKTVLTHYNPDLPLLLACDASPYGVGAVLAQQVDGVERPVAYASRSLSSAERNYSQLDKEALALVFGVKKFHMYLYGRQFIVTTDHKPLLGLLGENRPIPAMASSRLQRWALTLSAYHYQLMYKPGSSNANADGFSRLPLPSPEVITPQPADYVLVMEQLESTPVNPDKIRQWTNRDKVLSQVKEFIMTSWPESRDEELQPYFNRRTELSIHDGCIMWGARVIIPPQGRRYLLDELHDTHPGIVRMKALARSYIWWPKIDQELEERAKKCNECQSRRKAPAQAPMHPWMWPTRPWSRLHIDFAGPKYGHMFLVVVDARTKWLDVIPMKTASSATTIEKLRAMFAIHGLPDTIVSDNASIFTSEEFANFTKFNGIKHVKAAPFHPASNGLAERAVQTFKDCLDKMSDDNASLETKISRFLFRYRITPHTTTGQSPAEMLMGRKLHSRLDLVRPDLERKVHNKQQEQKNHHDVHAKAREFNIGDLVYAQNFARGPKWLPGQILDKHNSVLFDVDMLDGRVWRRHADHLISRTSSTDHGKSQTPTVQNAPNNDSGVVVLPEGEEVNNEFNQEPQVEPHVAPIQQPQIVPPLARKSNRVIKPPSRFGFD